MDEQAHETCEPVLPDHFPDDVVAAAQAYDFEHRRDDGMRGGSWKRVPDDQLRRLLAGALTEACEQIAAAVEKRCVDPEWPGDDISQNGELAAAIVRSWPEDLDA